MSEASRTPKADQKRAALTEAPRLEARTNGQPSWRRSYDFVDSTINRPLTAIVGSDTFADGLALAARSRRACLRLIERRMRRALHFLNLPAATDVRRLQDQLVSIQRQLAALPEQARAVGEGDQPASGPT